MIEFCKQLSGTDTVLEELLVRCQCTNNGGRSHPPPSGLNVLKDHNGAASFASTSNSSSVTLVDSEKSILTTFTEEIERRKMSLTEEFERRKLPLQNSDYGKEWVSLDNILKSRKGFGHLKVVRLEFLASPTIPAPDWWLNHARKVEKKLTNTRAKGVSIRSVVMYQGL